MARAFSAASSLLAAQRGWRSSAQRNMLKRARLALSGIMRQYLAHSIYGALLVALTRAYSKSVIINWRSNKAA